MNSRQLRDPPMTAILGRVCYTCFKSKTKKATLSKCGRCQRVRYCGADCQKADWKNGHKDLCNAFQAVENDRFIKAAVSGVLSDEPFSDLSKLNAIIDMLVKNQARYMVLALERSLTISEQNLIGWEPRCMGCGRTDRDMRTEAAAKGSGSAPPTLKACQACKLAFYCCTRHCDAVQHKHAGEPCEDGHDGLTQCQMNQELRLDEGFATTQTEAQTLSRWAPARVLPRWMPLGATNWEAEYSSWLTLEFRLLGKAVAPFLQAASDALSMPMTILNALEILNPDDAWTRKETLTVHILGAYDPEFQKANVFEEILHRLPEVKKLKVVLCGPELENIIDPSVWNIDIDMSTCRNCTRRGRKRIHRLSIETYHEFAKSLGTKFTTPDLAVAFNSELSEFDIQSWRQTVSFLVKNRIPSVFTAYNREVAEAEASLLTAAGAQLDPRLGPMKNTWGSKLAKKEPNKVTGFYAVNGWLAGGFR